MYESPEAFIKRLTTAIVAHQLTLKLEVELAEVIRIARVWLLEARERVLLPKDKEYTELDRKTRQDASLAQPEADYEFLLRLEALIIRQEDQC